MNSAIRRAVALADKLRRAAAMCVRYEHPMSAVLNRLSSSGTGGDEVTYQLRGGPAITVHSGPHDVRIINEVWIDRCYSRSGFIPLAGWNVIDIGAHKGVFTLWALSMAPSARVLCVEANPTSAGLLRRNLAGHEAQTQVVNAAVASTHGHVELFALRGRSGQDSTIRSRAESRGSIQTVHRVRTVRLTDIIAMIDGDVDLLKIDVEGSEYDILLGADGTELRRVKRLVMEADPISAAGDLNRADLMARLAEVGLSRIADSHGLVFAKRNDV
ncbi:MAG: FkbM family methyltransferase [bacterium]